MAKKDFKKRIVLLDSHAIIHRAYHALPDFASSTGTPTGALYGLSTMLLKIVADLKPDYIIACYDLPQKTFRHEAYADYKAGRKKGDENLIAQIISSREVFESFGIPIYDKAGFEADDILGTIAEQMSSEKEIEIVIASGDMDTLQLVDKKKVQVFTLKKGLNDTIMYDEDAVFSRFGFKPKLLPDYKGLRGDPSDNIIGIVGIGEKTATTLITKFGTLENMYKALKKNAETFRTVAAITPRILELLREGEEEAIFSKTLATIRRDVPITFTIPEKTWRENLDTKKVLDLFIRLEFRSLGDRIKRTFTVIEETPEETVPERVLEKMQIALWLLNSDFTNPELSDILNYAHAKVFAEAEKKILADIQKKNLDFVFEQIELPLIPVLKKMEENGILLDTVFLKKLSVEYHTELEKLEKKIYSHAGEEFNINSPKQLGEVIFDKMNLKPETGRMKKTEGGARSTKVTELEKLKGVHPIIEDIMEYRELAKLLSTYIDTLPNMVAADGRLHTHYSQTGTTTGRLASVNPNLQNLPIKTELGKNIRNGFISRDGYSLVSFDYSQIELRVAAILSQDEYLLKVFKEGRDIHASVASRVFGVSEKEVTPDMRRKAKVLNFGILYGMGVNALKENLKSTKQEAEIFYANYFKEFPTIAEYLESSKQFAREHGYTETLFGRQRQFAGIHSKIPFIKAMAERMAINAPVQGTAADVMKLAMIKSEIELEKAKLSSDAILLLQIHDELVYEIKDIELEKIIPVIQNAMEYCIPDDFTKDKEIIPLSVGISVTKRLGEK